MEFEDPMAEFERLKQTATMDQYYGDFLEVRRFFFFFSFNLQRKSDRLVELTFFRFPFDELLKWKHPGLGNKDVSDTWDNDEDIEDDNADEKEDGADEDFSGEEGDPKDDPEANGDGGSGEEEDVDENDDGYVEDEEEDEEEEDEEVNEPPSKKRK
ncbi:prothymosin alpha-B-like [Gossypium hirsutum]|uniref:Prothymosin alpha-B-like n=1 Tax=Gossypium hirsutum TaxID=3635 RepID=A0ABM3BW64_GOSHI|nr:prothymosin alpha-B-like [Gossypium hirsutum]